MWYDRSGKALADYDPAANTIIDVRLSPDNRQVAYASSTGIWTLDVQRKTKTRITFDQRLVHEPAWSPDGKTLMFSAQVTTGGNTVEIRSKAADGSGAEKTLVAEQNNFEFPAWSPDGKYLTYLLGEGAKMVSLGGCPSPGTPSQWESCSRLRRSPTSYNYRVSPDGRWVAYSSDESGQQKIYITSFPEGKGKWRVSASGGSYPAWSGNGKELFYTNLTDDLFACPVNPEGIGDRSRHAPASVPQRYARNRRKVRRLLRWKAFAGEPRRGRSSGAA